MNTTSGQESDRAQAGNTLAGELNPVMFLTLIFLLLFLTRLLVGPMLPAMEDDLDISHSTSGLLVLFIGLGIFLSQLGVSFLTARFGYKHCITLSLWGSAGAVLLVGLSGSVWLLSIGFFLIGAGCGIYVPSGIALISVLVRPQDWGKAMGIHEVAPNFALIVAPFFATLVLAFGSWRLGYLVVALFLALLGAAYSMWGTDAGTRGTVPDIQRIKEIAGNPAFWGLAGLISLAVGVEAGVYTVSSLFLVNDRGFDLTTANRLLGLSRIPGLGIVLLSGWLTDRLKAGTTLRLAFFMAGATVILLGLVPRSLSGVALFAQAATAACLFPPILSVASSISSPENRALTISLSLAVAPILGGGIVPAGIALAGELGSFGFGLAVMGVLVVMGVLLVRLLERGRP